LIFKYFICVMKFLPILILSIFFLCIVTVSKAQPFGWNPNSANYQYSMTATAQIRINGVLNHLANNHLAFFWKGQIRGYAIPQTLNGQAYYFASLFSNEYKGDTLDILAYIGSTQKAYRAVGRIVFQHHKKEGKISEPLLIDLILGDNPIIFSPGVVDYMENTCTGVLDIQATDNFHSEGSGLTYSISGGADASKFSVHPQTGVLSWNNFVPDFEQPADTNTDGQYEVKVKVTDASGFFSEQLILVNVIKFTAPPALICPSSQTVNTSNDGAGDCSTGIIKTSVLTNTFCEASTINYLLSGATTGSGTGHVPVNQLFNKGITTVQYSRTGTYAAQCTFTITVIDNELPLLSCPTDIAQNTDLNQCTAVINYDVSATDNCPGASLVRVEGLATGQSFPKGTTTVRWRVTDAVGQSVNCSFKVVITDAQPPSITCPQSIISGNSANTCGAVISYTTPVFSDNCSGFSASITNGLPSGSLFPRGTTTVACRVTDAVGLSVSCLFTVTVNDTQAPSISCPLNVTKGTDPGQCTAVVSYANPVSSDNCAGTTLSLISGIASGGTFPKGPTQVRWRVTDATGLSASCSFVVTVNDNQLPTISCPANMTQNTAPNTCSAIVNYANPTFSDNCSGSSISRVSGFNSGQSFPRGVTTVVWRATDAAGLSTTCSFRVTVNDVQAPDIICPPNIVKNTDPNSCASVTTFATATASDNCGSTSVTRMSGLPSGSAFPRGANNVVFRASDIAGNIKLCTLVVTINDLQLPAITCPSNVITTTSAGLCSRVVSYTSPTFSDNCAGSTANLFSGLASGSVFPTGTSTVVWRALDIANNSNTCSFTVTVKDAQVPSITCPPNTSVSGSGIPCGFPAAQLSAATASDNCAVTSLTHNAPGTLPAGVQLVTWTARDAANNSNTCSYAVTVGCSTLPEFALDLENTDLRAENAMMGDARYLDGSNVLMLRVSPNPASNSTLITIRMVGQQQQGAARLELYDLYGRLIWQKTTYDLFVSLDLTGITNGLYTVVARLEDEVAIKRLVVYKP
jgi:large repetitive protein